MKLKQAFSSMFIVLIIGFTIVTLFKIIGYVPAKVNIFLFFDKFSVLNFYEDPIYNGWITIFIILSIIFFFYELSDIH
ncbi:MULTISPECIES: hypothetical protein [unclassified Mammaliicoccus]|uniref:hypothetical protein n=1 Tax=unclassified Mammaliicoccus TaxID=2803851 RepID=UPI001EFA8A0A|nr:MULTISPECIES: hypothetical protein [unclassified Mammaliicoccus]